MAGQGYYENFSQFMPVDPLLDPSNDTLSTYFSYDDYAANGIGPQQPRFFNQYDQPQQYTRIARSVGVQQHAQANDPFTPSPPPCAYASDTLATQISSYAESNSSASPPPAKRRSTRVKNESITPKKDRSHIERRELPAVSPSGLRFTNAQDAELFGLRTKVNLPGDDWQTVAANPVPWVKEMMAAFDKEPIKQPVRHNKDAKVIPPAEWAKFQSNHVEKTQNHIKKNPAMVEIGAWQVFQAIIDAHKDGYLMLKAESTKICSVHMSEAVQAIADHAIIRFDVVRCMGIENLASSVSATVMRKVNCCNGNTAKKEREQRNAERFGANYENVLGSGQKSNGGNNKRKHND